MKQYFALSLITLITACAPQQTEKVENAEESLKDYCKIESDNCTHISKALGISSYKGEFYSNEKTTQSGLELRCYKGGKLRATPGGGCTIYKEPKTIGKGKFAVHIVDRSILPLRGKNEGCEITFGSAFGVSTWFPSEDEFKLEQSQSWGVFEKSVVKDELLPIFYIMSKSIGTPFTPPSSTDDQPERFIKNNPKASIIIGSIKVVEREEDSTTSTTKGH